MMVASSVLFTTFSRPILQYPFAPDRTSASRRASIMDSFIQYLLDRSRLEVSLIRITGATEDSCVITVECRLTKTGPISSTMSSMAIELTFNGFCFAKMRLPEVKTSIWGTQVTVRDQRLEILDKAIFKAYLRRVIVDDDTNFQLENGHCTVTALGVKAHCNYCLDLPIRGMMGPKASVASLEREGEDITMVVAIENPSPVEIDHGMTLFELRNGEGASMVELRGNLQIVRGTSECTLRGKLMAGGKTPPSRARLVGVCAEGSSLCRETASYFDVGLDMKPEFVDVFQREP
ncbi:hypothetical protein TOPH_01079 [Tolypocladium ophioglossoides CBS 100239]|uniref:Uncharacterized protein n=1 Tax=Tolypocladium ophioglossoides (strain CBS 100239) TaxID=1163406 RepID=A0A0L0NJJ5_TOLOC|nr:hypothetical protein TOPH_01079 [Tolypocladium ophioglossoides CBS 100239]